MLFRASMAVADTIEIKKVTNAPETLGKCY